MLLILEVGMRVGLVYPHSKASTHLCNSPVSLLFLATALRDIGGQEVSVFDIDGYSGGHSEMIRRVVDYDPDVVAMPIITDHRFLKSVRQVCRDIRAKLPNAKIIAGGPHVGAMPEETLAWYPELDMALVGEADLTLCDLVKQLESNVAKPEVAGLYYRDGDEVVVTPLGDPPKDLDSLPIPDRKFVWDNYRNGTYWRMDQKGMSDYIMTGRGCPFACRFCFKVVRGYRARSAEHVVKELVYLASLGITGVDFEDDLFTANKKRCIEICQMIRDAGLKFDMKVRSRVDTIDVDLLVALRKAGVKAVVYGIESGSQTVLNAMGKKSTVDMNLEAIRMTKKAGFRCHADMFFGFPGETRETMAETERFIMKARPTVINCGALYPLPGTEVYKEAKANGTLVGDWAVDSPDPYVKLPWLEDNAELHKLTRGFVKRFYTTPSVMWGMLRHAPPLNRRVIRSGLGFFKNRVFAK